MARGTGIGTISACVISVHSHAEFSGSRAPVNIPKLVKKVQPLKGPLPASEGAALKQQLGVEPNESNSTWGKCLKEVTASLSWGAISLM
jgi:hypothetical protein